MNNKLHISLSFDDGRIDNYYNVFPILKKYNIKATIHVITGYIDHSYKEKLASSKGPCTINQLKEMKRYGIEISLHGDQHTTNSDDYAKCIKKLKAWELLDKNYGFSIPHSEDYKIDLNFKNYIKETNTKYIRTGKNNNKLKLKNKIFYVLSNIFKSPYFFYKYNEININGLNNIDCMHLNSIVIKRKNNFNMIKKIIDKNKKCNKWIIFMFHSILNESDSLYKESEWSWSLKNFEKICEYISRLRDNNEVIIDSIINIVER